MSNNNERIAAVMAKVMEVDASDINEETSPETLDAWDSLSHVQLVLQLEKEFQISIPPEEGIEHFTDFKSVAAYIDEKTS